MNDQLATLLAALGVTVTIIGYMSSQFGKISQESRDFHARLCVLEDRFLYYIGAPKTAPDPMHKETQAKEE